MLYNIQYLKVQEIFCFRVSLLFSSGSKCELQKMLEAKILTQNLNLKITNGIGLIICLNYM